MKKLILILLLCTFSIAESYVIKSEKIISNRQYIGSVYTICIDDYKWIMYYNHSLNQMFKQFQGKSIPVYCNKDEEEFLGEDK